MYSVGISPLLLLPHTNLGSVHSCGLPSILPTLYPVAEAEAVSQALSRSQYLLKCATCFGLIDADPREGKPRTDLIGRVEWA